MELKQLKEMNKPDLTKLLAATQEKLRDFRFQVSMGQLKDVREIRDSRQLIARIQTLLKLTPADKK